MKSIHGWVGNSYAACSHHLSSALFIYFSYTRNEYVLQSQKSILYNFQVETFCSSNNEQSGASYLKLEYNYGHIKV